MLPINIPSENTNAATSHTITLFVELLQRINNNHACVYC